MNAAPPPAPDARHAVLHRDPHAYCSHPSIVALPDGGWTLAFMESMRRDRVLHSPSDPRFVNLLARSRDEGASWTTPVPVPDFGWEGVECPSLTPLRSGDLLLAQWKWRWSVSPGAASVPPAYFQAPGFPWIRGDDGMHVHRSTDGGATWRSGPRIDTAPHPGAYTTRAAAELDDGRLLLPVTDIPHWRRIYLLESADGGATWSAGAVIADEPHRQYSEPAILRLGGRLLVMIREVVTGLLHQCASEDGGRTWSAPEPTPMWGCPPHLLDLGDGRVLCTYGHRRPPHSIRCCTSEDEGRSWDPAAERTIRGDLPNDDLGYPSAVTTRDGAVFTVYYCEDAEGVAGIEATLHRI